MGHSKSDRDLRRPGNRPTGLFFLATLVLLLLESHVWAQASTRIVYWREAISVDNVRQGSTFQAAVVLDINYETGDHHELIVTYYINSAQPYDPQLNPTKLELEEIKGFTISPIKYPKGTDVRLKFSNEPLSVFSPIGKPIVLMFSVQVATDLPLGQYYLRGKLTYQPCNDKGCEAMRSVDVEIPVFIVDAKAKVRRINKHYFGVTVRDYLLVPVRAVKLIGTCSVKGCS